MRKLIIIILLFGSLGAGAQRYILGILATPGTLPPARTGQAAYLIGVGNSIADNYPRTNDTSSYERYAADALGGKTYQANGHPGWRTDQILTPLNTDAISKLPNYVIIEGGVNDAVQGYSASSIVANLKSMINQVIAGGSRVVYLPILPWTNGTTGQNTVVDDVNTQMIAWMQSTYPTHVIADARQLLGQFRSGGPTGNYWDLKSAYNLDGVHLTIAGNQALGAFIGQKILEAL